ncbi:MAG: hypothetical protein R2867_04870 [Caldilineaceae bacterium]
MDHADLWDLYLGALLQINGRYRFDLDGVEATFLPFAALHYLPIIKANRAPNRNSVLLMLGLAVLVGYGVKWLLEVSETLRQRRERGNSVLHYALPVLLIAAMLYEHLALPAPLSDARIPTVYAQIAADPTPISVMQIPLGWRNSFSTFGAERTQLQYYQTAHGKPMLGGNISRAPAFKMDYFKRIPLFQALRAVEFGEELSAELATTVQAQAGDLMYLYNIGYIPLYPHSRTQTLCRYLASHMGFCQGNIPTGSGAFFGENGIEAYRVVQPIGSDDFTLDLRHRRHLALSRRGLGCG